MVPTDLGQAEWSNEAAFDLPDIPDDDQVEIEEVPAAWISTDLGGLEAYDERNEPSKLLRAKEALLRSLFPTETSSKLPSRFMALRSVRRQR